MPNIEKCECVCHEDKSCPMCVYCNDCHPTPPQESIGTTIAKHHLKTVEEMNTKDINYIPPTEWEARMEAGEVPFDKEGWVE